MQKQILYFSNGKPNLEFMYRCLIDIAAGMDYLHSLGVINGDLKPANVLLKSTNEDARGFICKVGNLTRRQPSSSPLSLSCRAYPCLLAAPRLHACCATSHLPMCSISLWQSMDLAMEEACVRCTAAALDTRVQRQFCTFAQLPIGQQIRITCSSSW